MRKKPLPEFVTEFKDRHGKWRARFRRKGFQAYYFKSKPFTPEFNSELASCLDRSAPSALKNIEKIPPGSMSALIATYYASPEYLGLKASTKSTFRGILERFKVKHGTKGVQTLQRQHVRQIIGSMSATPSAANNLLDRLKVLMRFAMDIGWRDDDPTYRVSGFRITSDGFHAWTDSELKQFEDFHDIGTKPRLAYALLRYTVQRGSDVAIMHRRQMESGRLVFRQTKTGTPMSLRIHPDLQREIDGPACGEMMFMITEHGAAYSVKGFQQWFSRQCRLAGLPKECAAHGIRKAMARRMAESGQSNTEIKSMTGHKTDKEVARYTSSADQVRLSDKAVMTLGETKKEQFHG